MIRVILLLADGIGSLYEISIEKYVIRKAFERYTYCHINKIVFCLIIIKFIMQKHILFISTIDIKIGPELITIALLLYSINQTATVNGLIIIINAKFDSVQYMEYLLTLSVFASPKDTKFVF